MYVIKLPALSRGGISESYHDLRRYSATYASRNGIPLEVVSA